MCCAALCCDVCVVLQKPVWVQLQEQLDDLREAAKEQQQQQKQMEEQDARRWRGRLRSSGSTAAEEGQVQQLEGGAKLYRTRLRTRSNAGPSQTGG
jgi:hypothetical protein